MPPIDLHGTTLELHWAAQYLAAAGQTFAEPVEDDSHRAMTWNPTRGELVSSGLRPEYPFRLALRPADLTLRLLDPTGQPFASLQLRGRTREEGFEWISNRLADYLGHRPAIARPEYDMPAHTIDQGLPFSEGHDVEHTTSTSRR